MKKFIYPAALALALCASGARAAHAQSGAVRVGPAADEATAPQPADDEKRRPAPKSGERPARQEPSPLPSSTATALAPAAKGEPTATSDAPPRTGSDKNVPVGAPVKTAKGAEGTSDSNRPDSDKPESNKAATPAAPTPSPATPNPPANLSTYGSPARPSSTPPPAASPENIYRIGTGDVLDIRLLNGQDPRQSTLYPVIAGGVLDYPLLRDPLTVAGMTTDELAAQLIAELRHRGIQKQPQVRVSVREYASHTVLVSGLVNDPGTKILRREAIPLYVVVAEAQPKPEAGRAVIVSHATGKVTNVDLNDAAGLNTLVQTGDVVTLTVRPPEFFYVGGEIASPGQKDFHTGMTLTQALLASGGVTRQAADRVRVARQGADGRLVSAEYSLKQIEGGQVPDPALRAGDRIEVPRRK